MKYQQTYTITLSKAEATILEVECSALNAFEREIARHMEGYSFAELTPQTMLEALVSNKIEDWGKRQQQMRQKAGR
jgi:hypothetical protein